MLLKNLKLSEEYSLISKILRIQLGMKI